MMRSILLVCLAVFVTASNAAKVIYSCDTYDPLKGDMDCDAKWPEGCRYAKCGKNSEGGVKWFATTCYMNKYNKICNLGRGGYMKVSQDQCDPATRPADPSEVCPWAWWQT